MILSKILGIVAATVAFTSMATPVAQSAKASTDSAPSAQAAKAQAPAPQKSAGENPVSAKDVVDECAEEEVDQAAILESLRVLAGDQTNTWVEYAPVHQGKVDTSGLIRFLFLTDKETGNLITEIWLDKFGTVAVRSRIGPDGKVINELKQDETVYLIPEKKKMSPSEEEGLSEEEKAKKAAINKGVCDLKKILQEKIRQSVEVNKATQKVKTLAGTFNCSLAALKAPGGMVMGIYACNDAPVMKVARFTMPNGSSLELVASGTGAYSSFPLGVEPVSMDAMISMLQGLKKDIDEEQAKADLRRKADEKASSESHPAKAAPTASEAKSSSKLPEGMLYEEDPESRKGTTIQVHPLGQGMDAKK